MSKLARLAVIVFFSTFFAVSQAQDAGAPMRNADVVKMVKAKLQDSIIVMSVQSRPSQFDTSPEALISLKNAGVSPAVIEAMIRASTKPASPQTATVATTAAAPPSAAIFSPAGLWGSKQTRIEADRVFLIDGEKRTELKFFQPSTRTRAFFGAQQFAVLAGSSARMRTENKAPEFELILPNNVEVASVVVLGLLAVRPNGSREILIGAGFYSLTQGLPAERNMRIAYDKIADQSGAPEGYEIYRIKPMAPLTAGEYAFMVSKHSGGSGPVAFAGAGFNYNFYELGVD
jgi:hypothetical protein